MAALPPGRFGLPYLGETLDFFGNPYRFLKQRYDRYGPVFQTGLLGMKTIMLLNAEAQRQVLATNASNFTARDGYKNVEAFLSHSLALTDGDQHSRQRRLLAPAFHGRNMPVYLSTMERIIDAQLATWGTSGQKAFYPEMRQVAFTLASTLLLGFEPGADYDRFIHIWETFSKGFYGLLHIRGPFTAWGRSLIAQQQLEPMIRKIIAERRANPRDDVMGLLLAARDANGEELSDEELIDQVKLMIFAGYDTTVGTLSWILVELLRRPDLLERARAEVITGDPAAPLTYEQLRQMPFMDAVIKETLRLHPQAALMARGVRETFEFGGYSIPHGYVVMLSPILTHRMPDYFADPDTFDPDRFLAPRDEDAKTPYAWIGFGSGPRICVGESVARLEIKAFFTQLMRRFDVQLLPDQQFDPLYVPLSRPKSDVRISYQAR